jgi:hypothetical protein
MIFIKILRDVYPDNNMSSNSTNASTNASMSTFTPVAPSQELLDSLSSLWQEQQALELEQEEEIIRDEIRYHEYARQEEEKKNADLLSMIGPPPILRRETPSDYIIQIPPPLVRQDTILIPSSLTRERPEDYLFDPNSFISPDRIHNIQMPGTPVAKRTSNIDLSKIRPRSLRFN